MAGMSQGAKSTISIGGTKFCYVQLEDQTVYYHVDGSKESMCGSYYSKHKDRVRTGIIVPKVKLTMQPTPEELDALLPLWNFSESVDVWTPGEDFSSLTAFDLEHYKEADVTTYSNGLVDTVVLRAQKGAKPWALEMTVVFDNVSRADGASEMGDSLTAATTAPYSLSDATLTLNSASEECQSVVSVFNYNLAVQHNNSVTPTSIRPTDIDMFLGVDTPWTSDEVALLSAFTGETAGPTTRAVTGYSGSLAFSSGTKSTTITYHNLKLPQAKLPSVMGKEEIRNKMFFEAFGDSSNMPLTITNDVTA